MKRVLTAAAIVAALAGVTPALAQPGRADHWQPINARQSNLEHRIDVGVRNGSLTRVEAQRLRGEFRAIERLEISYRRNGLTVRERADLDRRFTLLSARIRAERHDRQDRADLRGHGRYR